MRLSEYEVVGWVEAIKKLDPESEDFEEKMNAHMNMAYEWCTDKDVSDYFGVPGYGHIFSVLSYSVWLWEKLRGETLEYKALTADEEHSVYNVIRIMLETIHW